MSLFQSFISHFHVRFFNGWFCIALMPSVYFSVWNHDLKVPDSNTASLTVQTSFCVGDRFDVNVIFLFLFHSVVHTFILALDLGNMTLQTLIEGGHPNSQHALVTHCPKLHPISEFLSRRFPCLRIYWLLKII